MSIYLDASVIVPIIVRETWSAAVDRFLTAHHDTFVVSDFAAAEVASAVSRHVRMEAFSATSGQDRLADFDQWRLAATDRAVIFDLDMQLTDALVRCFDLALRTPDALHLAACLRGGFRLATLDQRLARAALALGVSTEIPT